MDALWGAGVVACASCIQQREFAVQGEADTLGAAL